MLKKYSWISWIAITAASGMAYANEPAQVSNSETEISIARARVQQLVRQINEREAQVAPEAISSDFVTARAEFMRKIREGMPRFEQEVAEILGRFDTYRDRVIAIETSTAYDLNQKSRVLQLLYNDLQPTLSLASGDYHRAIQRVFTLPGNLPTNVWVTERIGRRYTAHFTSPGQSFDVRLRHPRSYYTYESCESPCISSIVFDAKSELSARLSPIVFAGCQTRVCMSLMMAEWQNYIELVQSTVNVPLLVNGHASIQLTEWRSSPGNTEHFLSRVLNTIDRHWENDLSIPFSN